MDEGQKAFSNAQIPFKFQGKAFLLALGVPWTGYVVGYITHEQDNGFMHVCTTQIITGTGKFPINCNGLWPKSTFRPSKSLEWIDMPVLLTEYDTKEKYKSVALSEFS